MASVVRGGALRLAECPCDLRLSRNFRSFPPRSFTCRCYADVVVLGARLSRRLGGGPAARLSPRRGGSCSPPTAFRFQCFPACSLCLLLASLSVSAPRSVKKKIVGNSTRIALNLSNNLGTVDVLLILIISPRTRGILPFVQVCFCVDSPFRDV